MSVQEHAGNEKSCVWHAADFADGELKNELFCIRFGSVESKYNLDHAFSLLSHISGIIYFASSVSLTELLLAQYRLLQVEILCAD